LGWAYLFNLHFQRLSWHRFGWNAARSWLSVIDHNLGNLWRRVLPNRIDPWSLTSLLRRLVKTGGRLLKHARYYWTIDNLKLLGR